MTTRCWPGLVVVLALAAGSLPAQSLGELAAKEKRRREEEQKKNKGPARVVTTEDLANVQGTTATEAAKPVLAQELGGKPRSSADEIDQDRPREKPANPEAEARERGGQDEKTWRAQAAGLRQEIQEVEQKVKALEEQVNKLFGDIQRSTDTYEILRLRGEQEKLAEQIKVAKRERDGVRQELVQLEDSARRAGVPPGWIR